MFVEWVRSCKRSQWAVLKDYPGIIVKGRYWRAGDDAEPFPGYSIYCSREWSKGEQDSFDGLGELRDVETEYDYGRPPEHKPLSHYTGSIDCISSGEDQLPWPVIHEINADSAGAVVVTGAIPSIRLDFAATPGPCNAILADGDDAILADGDDAILAECITCPAILADGDDAILADGDDAILAECHDLP